jgi:hypothetical protein
MYFQVLDNKQECYSYYKEGSIYINEEPSNIERTWNYVPYLKNKDIKYGEILVGGKRIKDIVPPELENKWKKVENQKKAYLNSFVESKVNLVDFCFYDLVPEYFLYEYCEVKNKITKWVFENFDIPRNHDNMVAINSFVSSIKNRRLKINWSNTEKIKNKERFLEFKKSNMFKNNIVYNPYGTVTGRLTTKPESFPILNLDKNFRQILEPKNDVFLEYDYNAAELRVLLLLATGESPDIDIHDFNMKEMDIGNLSRDEIKTEIFKWLYNPYNHEYDNVFSKVYNKEIVLEKFTKKIDPETVLINTPFNRQIYTDDYHSLNYLLQSTTSDLLLSSAIQINNILEKEGNGSEIVFTLHDSIVIDFNKKDEKFIEIFKNMLENTVLGYCKCGISVGKNYGKMRKLDV